MYHTLAQIYDRATQDIDYDRWAQELKETICTYTDGKKLVEMACGTGQIGIRLQKSGYTVTGIDISEEMLQKAGENARKAGVKMQFVQQDMREFRLTKPVDVIVCPCDGVNYLLQELDLKNFIACCFEWIKAEGLLIFDISSGHKLEEKLADNVFYEVQDDYAYIWQNTREENRVKMDITSFLLQSDGSYRRQDESKYQRIYRTEEIENALCGFDVLEMKRVCYNKEGTDDRIQFVCKRRTVPCQTC